MSLGPAIIKQYGVHLGVKAHAMTLTGHLTLDLTYPNILKIDPDGAKNVTLPADAYHDALFWIFNAAGGAEDITVKNAAASTVGTISQNESAVFCNIAGTWTLMGIIAIALS